MKSYTWVFSKICRENSSFINRFSWNFILEYFSKICRENSSFLNWFSWNFILGYFSKICRENSSFIDGFSWNFILEYFLKYVEKVQVSLTDFHKILYLSIFRKSVERIQVSWKSDKNNGYFTLRPIYIYDISLSSTWNRNVSDKSCRENQNTHFRVSNCFSKIVPFMKYCGKIR
jgi:hypothetical protein